MPLVRYMRFSSSIRTAFEWDGVDDSGLRAFLSTWSGSQAHKNFALERDGSDVYVKWEVWERNENATPYPRYEWDGVTYGSLQIHPGDILGDGYSWAQADPPTPAGSLSPEEYGFWRCDQYGRPYDLNDLLAT